MGILSENKIRAEELSRYSRLCYERGLVGAAGGNLSVRATGQDAFLVTASGVSLRDVSPENIVVINGEGKILDGPAGLRPSKEIGFHVAIYLERPEVRAVIHVHPPFATAFSAKAALIPPATVSAKLKLKQGPLVLEANPGSTELTERVIEALRNSSEETSVLLMERHGLVSFKGDLCEAFNDAELAEDTAKVAMLSSRPEAGH